MSGREKERRRRKCKLSSRQQASICIALDVIEWAIRRIRDLLGLT